MSFEKGMNSVSATNYGIVFCITFSKIPCVKLSHIVVVVCVCCYNMLQSEVGGKRVCKDRAPQPGGRFVSSVRAARSVIHVESVIK